MIKTINETKQNNLVKNIDLLIGGSPCQGFSIAGKRLNFDDPRSALFFEFVKALKILKPKYFLLENVKMKKEWRNIISQYLEVEPIEINSALVSAQNRRRLYWTNIPGITQPEDKHIYLQDILEEGGFADRLKSYCIDTSYFKETNLNNYFERKRRQLVFNKPVRVGHFNSGGQGDRVYAVEGKSVSLSANAGGKGGKTGLYMVAVEYDRKNKIGKELEKSLPLMASDWRGLNRNQKQNAVFIPEELKIRKLTPIECERLQTLPDNYTEGISNTQRYKCIGNGWTVDVVAHIFSFIPENHLTSVVSLFDGISCGQLALIRANKTYEKYFASEIDKYAITITQKHFPNTIQLGDVTKIDWLTFNQLCNRN